MSAEWQAEQMIQHMLANQHDEFEIHRDGQIVASVGGHWRPDDNLIAFAAHLVNVRGAGDRIVGKNRPEC